MHENNWHLFPVGSEEDHDPSQVHGREEAGPGRCASGVTSPLASYCGRGKSGDVTGVSALSGAGPDQTVGPRGRAQLVKVPERSVRATGAGRVAVCLREASHWRSGLTLGPGRSVAPEKGTLCNNRGGAHARSHGREGPTSARAGRVHGTQMSRPQEGTVWPARKRVQ
jgi:hypothetical protein